MTIYQQCKIRLKNIADVLKREIPKDKPAIRMHINDAADLMAKSYKLNSYQVYLLSHYACKLHPK